ncbi:MAG: type II secretion system protein [Burkholderiales bacterium]|nr:type II secretion system protein [Burkholderiales bacterium]
MGARRHGGFTLIEMLVVVTIVGILAAAAFPVAEFSVRRSRELELRQALRTLRIAIDEYKHAADAGKIDVAADASGYPPSLDVLVEGVADKSTAGRRIYFLRRIPRDPFAEATLPPARSWGLRSYESPPDAPAPGRDVYDVRSQSTATAIDGSRLRDW